MPLDLYLVRHGETEWSASGRHTGRTDLPLTRAGEGEATWLAGRLGAARFSHVYTSPRLRARRTCELAGWGAEAVIEPDLAEWDYGDYEGLRTDEILKARPGWSIYRDGCPGGESPGDAGGRADRLLGRLRALDGNVALFTHGHFGRLLGARWVGLAVADSASLRLDTASLGILGRERGIPVIALWNERPAGPAP
jgi:broad specificity phosphatase PhoE